MFNIFLQRWFSSRLNEQLPYMFNFILWVYSEINLAELNETYFQESALDAALIMVSAILYNCNCTMKVKKKTG